jgi:hypothetical protein
MSRPERTWLAMQNRAGERHLVPANEPREWSDDCWCLPVWDAWVDRLGSGAFWHNPQRR